MGDAVAIAKTCPHSASAYTKEVVSSFNAYKRPESFENFTLERQSRLFFILNGRLINYILNLKWLS